MEEGATASEDDAPAEHGTFRLHQDLSGTRRHDTGQRPSGNGDRPLIGTGGNNQEPRRTQEGTVLHQVTDRERIGFGRPDRGARHILDIGALDGLYQGPPTPVILAQNARLVCASGRVACQCPVDLSARCGLLVEEHHLQPAPGRFRGGGEPGRPRTDNDHVSAHRLPPPPGHRSREEPAV